MVNNTDITRTISINTKKILRVLCLVLTLCGLAACSATPENTNNRDKGSDINAVELIEQADNAYEEEHWLEAEQGYRRVIAVVPDDYYAWFRLANTQLRQGRIDSAINYYNEARKRNPEEIKPYYNVSTAYFFKALEALRQAGQLLRENDPGKYIVARRIRVLEKLVQQPAVGDVSSGVSVPIKNVSLSVESK
jgi:tetratricopeptide (TPR) repeat protein